MAQATAAGPGRVGLLLRRWWTSLLDPKNLVLLVVVLIIGYLALVPLGYLVWGTFFDASGFTLRFFGDAYARTGFGEMIRNSLTFSIGSTTISVTIGTFLAYVHSRTDVPLKRLIFAASLVPLIIPGILHTIAWIFLLSPRIGILNRFLEPALGPEAFDIFTMGGMIWVEGLHLSPLVFLLMAAAFRSMDPSLEESALISGARLGTVFRRITVPLVKPALFASILVMMVRTLEAFEVPQIIGGGRIPVFTSQIYDVLDDFPPKYGQAGAYAMTLLVLTSIGVFVQARLSKRGKAFQTVTGKGFRPRPLPLGKWRWPFTGMVMVYFVLAVILPLAVLMWISMLKFFEQPSLEAIGKVSFDNYGEVFSQRAGPRAFRNSLLLGLGSATIVMMLMAVASWIVVRTRIRGRWVVDNLAFTPLVIPGLVMGLALLFVYLRFPLPIYGSIWILFIAYMTRYMPYGMRYATTSMYQISGELEESAQTSGASWWQTFRRVNLPLLMPGLIAGWIYILLVSFRELSSSILLYSPGNEVLAILIFEQYNDGHLGELAAMGMIMVLTLVVLVVAASRLGARIGVKEH